ncbi:MAG TPA: alpha-L-glutamate ligase, partial [Pseudoneobacillus sp.]|nr:alpha-L-glutamate ligase [Pseudoneobacillus sp.]
VQVAGIEFIRNQDGEIFTYDINTNTNYNSDAEAKAGKYGMLELAKFLKSELNKQAVEEILV